MRVNCVMSVVLHDTACQKGKIEQAIIETQPSSILTFHRPDLTYFMTWNDQREIPVVNVENRYFVMNSDVSQFYGTGDWCYLLSNWRLRLNHLSKVLLVTGSVSNNDGNWTCRRSSSNFIEADKSFHYQHRRNRFSCLISRKEVILWEWRTTAEIVRPTCTWKKNHLLYCYCKVESVHSFSNKSVSDTRQKLSLGRGVYQKRGQNSQRISISTLSAG